MRAPNVLEYKANLLCIRKSIKWRTILILQDCMYMFEHLKTDKLHLENLLTLKRVFVSVSVGRINCMKRDVFLRIPKFLVE